MFTEIFPKANDAGEIPAIGLAMKGTAPVQFEVITTGWNGGLSGAFGEKSSTDCTR